MFCHKFSQISDAILVLNPLHYGQKEELKILLNKRLRFKIMQEVKIVFNENVIEDILKIYCSNYNYHNFEDIARQFKDRPTVFFHITKPGGFEELKVIYGLYASQNARDICDNQKALSPILPAEEIPHFFIPIFSVKGYRNAMSLYSPSLPTFTGNDMSKGGNPGLNEAHTTRVNYMLELTVGEQMKAQEERKTERDSKQVIFTKGRSTATIQDQKLQQTILCYNKEVTKSVHIKAETQNIGIYELRIRRLASKRDYNLDCNIVQPETDFYEYKALKDEFIMRALYFASVRLIKERYAPSFYQYRIFPQLSVKNYRKEIPEDFLDYAYECEEFMGKMFLEEVALAMKKYREGEKTDAFKNLTQEERRGSLVAFLWGQKIGKMTKKLSTISRNEISGYGKIIEITGHGQRNKKFRGELKDEGANLWKAKATEVNEMVKEIQTYITQNTEHFKKGQESLIIIKKWMEEIWIKEEYVHMWKEQELVLVPEQINEYNIRIYGKVTRISKMIEMSEGKMSEIVDLKKLHEHFERTLTKFHKDPNFKVGRVEDYTRQSEALTQIIDKCKNSMRFSIRKDVPAKVDSGEYDFRRHVEFEESKKTKVFTESLSKNFQEMNENQLKSGRLLVHKKDSGISNIGCLARRTKYYFPAMMMWLINLKLRKTKAYDELFEDKTDYNVCLNSLIQGFSHYYNKTKKDPNEILAIQCEYIFFGMREFIRTVNEIKRIQEILQNLIQNSQFNMSSGFEERRQPISSKTMADFKDEKVKLVEAQQNRRQELRRYLSTKEEELDIIFEEITYPSLNKLLLHEDNLIHIIRSRYYENALYEYYEPDLSLQKYKKQVNNYANTSVDFLPERLKKKENRSQIQEEWDNPKPVYKTMLRECPNYELEKEVTVDKEETVGEKKMKEAMEILMNGMKELKNKQK